MEDELNVLPCLQELKKVNIGAFGEQEQRVGYWDEKKAKTIILSNLLPYTYTFSRYTTSDMFDSMWNRDSLGKKLVDDELINKNGLLNIPHMTNYGFNKECGKMTTEEIWKMYMQFLNSKFEKSDEEKSDEENSNEGHSALLVSHHNRMKQLIPLKNNCNAYANNFTLHIEIKKESGKSVSENQSEYTIKFNIAFEGFPDKNEFDSSCPISTCGNTTETDNNEPIKIGQSEGEYTYCCNDRDISKNINTKVIENALKKGLEGTNFKKKIDIFIVRHGNALHNKPMGKHVLDTSLTPLGIFQAQKLGEILKCKNKGIINANTVLCCSFLQRTQLTALCIYKAIMGDESFKDFSKLSEGYKYLNGIAKKRYKKYAKKDGIKIFYTFSPLKNNNDIKKDFENYVSLDDVSKGGKKKTRKARVSHKTTYKRKGKKSNSHRRRRRRNTKKRIR